MPRALPGSGRDDSRHDPDSAYRRLDPGDFVVRVIDWLDRAHSGKLMAAIDT